MTKVFFTNFAPPAFSPQKCQSWNAVAGLQKCFLIWSQFSKILNVFFFSFLLSKVTAMHYWLSKAIAMIFAKFLNLIKMIFYFLWTRPLITLLRYFPIFYSSTFLLDLSFSLAAGIFKGLLNLYSRLPNCIRFCSIILDLEDAIDF